jgi:hypothetical protein
MNIPTPDEIDKGVIKEHHNKIFKNIRKQLTPKILDLINKNDISISIRVLLENSNYIFAANMIKKILSDFENKGWRFSLFRSTLYISGLFTISGDNISLHNMIEIEPYDFFPLCRDLHSYNFILTLSSFTIPNKIPIYSTLEN